MHKLLLCCFLLAICPPFLYCKLFCCQDGGIVLRQHNYFNRHNLNRHFGAKRRSQHFAMTATYQIITLYNPAVPPSSANRLHFRRRNLVQHIAAGGIYSGFQPQAELSAATRRKKSGHSNPHDRPYLIYYSVYPRRSTTFSQPQTFPKAEFTVAFSHRRNCQRRPAAKKAVTATTMTVHI